MFVMAIMFFGAGLALGAVRANEIATGGGADAIATLQHLQAAFMFLGFAAVFPESRSPLPGFSGSSARAEGRFRRRLGARWRP